MTEIVNAREMIDLHRARISLYVPILANLQEDSSKYRDFADQLPFRIGNDGCSDGCVNRQRMYSFFFELMCLEGEVAELIQKSRDHVIRLEKEICKGGNV